MIAKEVCLIADYSSDRFEGMVLLNLDTVKLVSSRPEVKDNQFLRVTGLKGKVRKLYVVFKEEKINGIKRHSFEIFFSEQAAKDYISLAQEAWVNDFDIDLYDGKVYRCEYVLKCLTIKLIVQCQS